MSSAVDLAGRIYDLVLAGRTSEEVTRLIDGIAPDAEVRGQLVAHLARAQSFHERLAKDRITASPWHAAFQRLALGIIVADHLARVYGWNEEGRRIAATHFGLASRDGVQRLDALRVLPAWTACFTASRPPHSAWFTAIRLPSSGPARVHALAWLPVRHERSVTPGSAVLFVTDGNGVTDADAAAVGQCLGLTRGEARVAAHLASGKTVREVAAHLGVSTNAVRFHLKAIFGKTGTRRQAELVYRVTTSPAGLFRALPTRRHGEWDDSQ